MNLIFHKYKPYSKGKTYITFWYVTYIKYDVLNQLNNIYRDNRIWKHDNQEVRITGNS